MLNRISLRLYLFCFFMLVGFVPGVVFSLLEVRKLVWLLALLIIVLLSLAFTTLVARPFQKLAEATRRADQENDPNPIPHLNRLAPGEALELAEALTELTQRQAEAKMKLAERVAERTAELAFSRDLLFQQNVELENLNQAITQRNDENQHLVSQIATERNRFNAVLTGVSEGVVLVDADNRVIFANPAALRSLGLPEDAVLTDYEADRLLLVPSARSQQLAAQLAAGEQFDPIPVERNGRTWGVSLNPIYDDTGLFMGVAQVQRDITEAARVDRMKTEFISLVSHELRTPLTSIKGYVELVLDGDTGPINEMQHRFLETARNSSDRLVSLINDLLDVSRIESGRTQLEPGLLYINRALNNVIEPMRLSARERDLSVHLDLAPELPPAWADRDRVTQILTNLLSNAFKYSRPGGKIEVKVQLSENRQFLEIEVADTGIGMSEEEQKLLFSKFFRSSNPAVRSISGTGLGLSITKALVEMHGGRVWVKSQLDQGSTFGFSLPIAQLSQDELLSEDYLSQNKSTGSHKILLVDTERAAAELLGSQLEQEGYSVTITPDGEEALLRAALEQPDAIVLLPGLSGREGRYMNLPMLHRLKGSEPTRAIPVILLSIGTEAGDTFRLKALAYLTKPVSEKEVVAQINQLLGHPVSPYTPFVDEDGLGRGLILLANDDPPVRLLLDQYLQQAGYTTLLASNGAQALTLARRHLPDLTLLDLGILDYEGLEVLHTLKTEQAQTETLVLTVTDRQPGLPDCELLLAVGTIEFVDQTVSATELAAHLGLYMPTHAK